MRPLPLAQGIKAVTFAKSDQLLKVPDLSRKIGNAYRILNNAIS